MLNQGSIYSQYGLENNHIFDARVAYWNLNTPLLYEEALRRQEVRLSTHGPLVVKTGQFTGRAAKDKYTVKYPTNESMVWWNDNNKPMDPEKFEALRQKVVAYLENKDLFVQDCFAGADPNYRMPIRVVTEKAWHSLFARNLFIPATTKEELANHIPQFTIIDASGYKADPAIDGTRSETFIAIDYEKRLVLIAGTEYGGEIKKSVFTIMNYLLPQQDVLSMHCSANIDKEGDVAIFFGLSGTGKTTLSTEHNRLLIGDDEHGWSKDGVFNLEGGCYAKVIHISEKDEPEIFGTTRRFGTVLENVGFDRLTGEVDYDDDSITENTRAAYPINYLSNAALTGMGGHPKNIVMLTADAFGVLPPIASLNPEQAMYYFLSGYTAKVAGTEKGVTEPSATFSTCFGAPFMALHPSVYADMLGQRIKEHGSKVWLVNTGWSGGPYGVGKRMRISYTRAMVNAALSGALDGIPVEMDPNFQLAVPTAIPGVPPEVLNARSTWSDPAAYDAQARKLVAMFQENFKKYENLVTPEVRSAGPR